MTDTLFDTTPPPTDFADSRWSRRDICENKHGGDEFSARAFSGLVASLPERRAEIYRFIRQRGALGSTCHECAHALNKPMHAVSGRFTELKADGLIVRSRAEPSRRSEAGTLGGVWIAAEFAEV